MPLLSLIVPVYNRPEELDELLRSLTEQAYFDYEVIIVEDGSAVTSDWIVSRYRTALPCIEYISTPNGGPSKARNIGAEHARGEYLVILDSDVVLPPQYLQAVDDAIRRTQADAFGGPDASAPDFSPMQKAVSYAMTSFLTTGGIRGGSAGAMERFKPRTYNMGVRRTLFQALGGFAKDMRYGEDIDFSLRLEQAGARVLLFPEAFVYHKRRTDLKQFFRQVFHSGAARIELERRHPGSTRLVHYFPMLFVLLSLLGLITGFVQLYALAIFVHASYLHGVRVGWRAVVASFVQLWGYGLGFATAKLNL